jgi:hypothetical protein
MDQAVGALESAYRRSWANVLLTVGLSLVGVASMAVVALALFAGEERLGLPGQLTGLAFLGMILFSTYPLLLLRLFVGEPRRVEVHADGLVVEGGTNRVVRWEEVRAATWSVKPLPTFFGRIWCELVDSPWCRLELADGSSVIFSDVSMRRVDLGRLVEAVRRHTEPRASWTLT